MKREGRQHGVVRSHTILPNPLSRQRRYVKTVDSTSVAGVFTKVSTKPTNQSKFTGKCGQVRCLGCHIQPVCKSREKAKGTMKLRSVGSDREMIGCPAGTSAVVALAYLASRDAGYDDYYYSDDDNLEFGNGVESNIVREDGQIGVEDEDECVSYCDLGLCLGNGEVDGWYLV